MNIPFIFGVVMLALAIIGVIVVVILLLFKSATKVVTEYHIKAVSEGMQTLSALSSLGTTFAVVDQKPEWLVPAINSAFCVLVWKFAQILIDANSKRSLAYYQTELAAMDQKCDSLTSVLSLLRRGVIEKCKRLDRAIEKMTSQSKIISHLRTALTPDTHLDDILQNLAIFWQRRSKIDRANFRIGLYVLEGDQARPIKAHSLNDYNYNIFSSHVNNHASFCLSKKERPSSVVSCFLQKQTIIIEDCARSAEEGNFYFFNDGQKAYLCSYVVYHMGKCLDFEGKMTEAVLAIDTNLPAFFKSTEAEFIEFCLREFVDRIKLELLLHVVLQKKGENNES